LTLTKYITVHFTPFSGCDQPLFHCLVTTLLKLHITAPPPQVQNLGFGVRTHRNF